MMRVIKSLTVLLILILLTSCLNEQPRQEIVFDQIQFEKVGELHNEALVFSLKNSVKLPEKRNQLQWIENNLQTTLSKEYDFYRRHGFKLDEELLNMLQRGNTQEIFNRIESLELSPEGKFLLQDIGHKILENPNINDFYLYLDRALSKARKNLNPEELVIIFSAASIAKSSMQLWYPQEKGGEGGLSYLPHSEIAQLRGINWGKIILSDYVGIVTGATAAVVATGGAAAIPNPALGGLPPASVIGLIEGAGMSLGAAIN